MCMSGGWVSGIRDRPATQRFRWISGEHRSGGKSVTDYLNDEAF